MELEKILLILATGASGAYMAKKRGLNPFFWFGVCCMFGWIALLGFIFLPYLYKELTKKTPQVGKSSPPPFFPAESIWYYLDEKETQNGPMSFLKLQEIKQQGIVQGNSYIWNETFNNWKQWKDVFPAEQQEG